MTDEYSEQHALLAATRIGQRSPCAKSQRGVVIFHRERGLLASGYNAQPFPFQCDGSELCRANCNKLCVHAEVRAIHELYRSGYDITGSEMLHVKVQNGKAVPSGPPSCWQCSREILVSGIVGFWLLHDSGLRRYSAEEFHTETLKNTGLPVISR